DAMMIMSNEEDKAFLVSQRKDRTSSSMVWIDVIHTKVSAEKRKRMEVNKQHKEKSENEKKAFFEVSDSSQLALSSSSETETEENNAEFTLKDGKSLKRRKENPHVLLSPEMTTAKDRFNISDRVAMGLSRALAKTSRQNLKEMTLSQSSIGRHRMVYREALAKANKNLILPPKTPLPLHWNAKLLPDVSKSEKVDRRQPRDPSRGPQDWQQHRCEPEWNLMRGLVFDTTASNTGLSEGAYAKIQAAINREIIWIVCRHHILEVVLSDVFKKEYGPSSGPNINLSMRFQEQWRFIDETRWKPATHDENLVEEFSGPLVGFKERVLKDLRMAIESKAHLRDDYKEPIVLSYTFLGEIPKGGVKIRAPGDFYQARWMKKAIYALKNFLFREQFTLTAHEMRARFSPQTPLPYFVTAKTKNIFNLILPNGRQESESFLAKPPSSWNEDETYQQFMASVASLKRRNGYCSDHTIQLITKDEAQKQYLLKVLAQHRKDVPSMSKAVFLK
ncbi:hypothetical protein Hamer_G003445, partial [Homarus americanus]